MKYLLQDGLQSLRGMSVGNDMLSAQAYSPYGEPMFTDMPTEFGFTGEQTDSANDLVYLRARVMNPKLWVFGSQDPFEGDESEPLTMNGYGWVEGNTPNLTDASGMSPNEDNGRCDKPCPELLNELARFAAKLNNRIGELLEDFCRMYDRDILNQPVPGKNGCGRGDWNGHKRAIDELKSPVRKILNCRDSNNVRRFDPTSASSPQNCFNSSAYTAATSGLSFDTGDNARPTRHQADFAVILPSATAGAPSAIPHIATPERLPEPGGSYGRGHDVPNSSVPYPGWTTAMSYAMLGSVGVMCAAGAITLSSVPAISALTTSATYCALYPQLCSQSLQP